MTRGKGEHAALAARPACAGPARQWCPRKICQASRDA
jgi:hypothetical protein